MSEIIYNDVDGNEISAEYQMMGTDYVGIEIAGENNSAPDSTKEGFKEYNL